MSSVSSSGFTRFRHRPDVLSRNVGATVIVSTGQRAALEELSGGAATAWQLLRVPRTFPDLVDILCKLHEIEADSIADDIGRMLDDLVERDLVEEVVDFDV